jgi:hypothetical protein
MRNYPSIGIQIPDILLPKAGIDLSQWAVIACDQFTSQPEYWHKVEELVGNAPSTYNLILPEVFLGKEQETARLHSTQQAMRHYIDQGLLVSHEGLIYVERTTDGKTRRGLVLALDLEQYDYNKGSRSLIRATEGTIIDRLPPRIRIREGATVELPHILVLIDDPQRTVIEPVAAQAANLTQVYDFDLMLGSGHLRGYRVDDPRLEARVVSALEKLADPQAFAAKYNVSAGEGVLLFAMGDGNHSLATAKAIWEKIKGTVGMDHPARYALVEIENVHDEGLDFEPIHRVLFDVRRDVLDAMRKHFDGNIRVQAASHAAEMVRAVDEAQDGEQVVGLITPAGFEIVTLTRPTSNLAVGTLQAFLDDFVKTGGAEHIDYVHGEDVVTGLGAQPGNAGLYVPGMNKSDLFKTVILDGALPRKTFSMGEAKEKRFYMECRKIA